MKKSILTLLLALFLMPAVALAANYSATFRNADAKTALTILRKATGYEFVYLNGVLDGVTARVSGDYKDVSLERLFDQTLVKQMGLDYKVIDKTVSLTRRMAKSVAGKERRLTGCVTDEAGEPLAGVSVICKGTSSGCSTDLDGNYSINISGDDAVLTFAMIGMQPQEIEAGSRSTINVVMRENARMLDDVVVTGYQNIKRENATGAYQTVTEKDMDKRYSGTLVDNLEGKVPGLVTYNNGVNSGENAMVIRGASSFQASTKPLVVVDGLPIESSIETVNPYDIANITVLKDAAAASIYGARASNGVIVITTKRANSERVTIDFNTDITLTESNDYSNMGWASAAEVIELEKYNFDYVKNQSANAALKDLTTQYNNPARRFLMQPVVRDLMANYVGDMTDSELKNRFDKYSSNDYRQEWRDAFQKSRVLQQYNLSLRVNGKALASSVVLNYKTDNMGTIDERQNTLTFKYRGDLKAAKWLDVSFGANVISSRSKSHLGRPGINTYAPFYSLYNSDGSLADMTLGFDENVPAIKNPEYGLKTMWYNPIAEKDMNISRNRNTNIRAYVHTTFKILPGWTAQANFQYEDIYSKTDAYYEADSYTMRNLYNRYTGLKTVTKREYDYELGEMVTRQVQEVTHYIPNGGRRNTASSEGAYWTARAQTNYNRTLWGKHDIDVLGGFEFRESRTKLDSNLYLGYDDRTQTNANGFVNWKELSDVYGTASVMGNDYPMNGAPSGSDFSTGDILHRFYSIYMTANYVYDGRFALSGSWRIDKTDLFGTDPKFRGRPLWSAGASWNMHNEAFMHDISWINILKPRVSYGLTGNIDSSVSSFLTAEITSNYVTSSMMASLKTPPNDQLRWEKTATWNFGVDFSLLDYRLRGSFDYYRKSSSDILTLTDIDQTSGWDQLTINNGSMVNNGFELQLNGEIIRPRGRNSIGVNAGLNLSFNSNEVTKVAHEVSTGYEYLKHYTLHKGYPVHSLFSYDFAGLVVEDGKQYYGWKGADGQVHTSDVWGSSEFKVEDAVYSGSLDPKFVGSFVPEITYAGFSLSAMLSYYGGHVMRVNTDDWTSAGSASGYGILPGIQAVPSSYLNYWRTGDKTKYPANGLPSDDVVGRTSSEYMSTNVVPADYLKVRNIVLGYTLPSNLTQYAGIKEARLRVQMNNIATWVRNSEGKDPEAVNPVTGANRVKTPKSYTFSLLLTF